jgi:hypothetical protein
VPDIQSTIADAAWEALQGRVEAAIEISEELVGEAPPGIMFALRAQYERADGEIVWVTLAPLTPLSALPVTIVAVSERGELVLTEGYFKDIEGVAVPATLLQVTAYVKMPEEK